MILFYQRQNYLLTKDLICKPSLCRISSAGLIACRLSSLFIETITHIKSRVVTSTSIYDTDPGSDKTQSTAFKPRDRSSPRFSATPERWSGAQPDPGHRSPGFGKTMLVAEWVSQAPQRVAWLSLDESDNDVVTLVGYLIASIRQLFPEACPDTLALIHAALVPKPEALVSVLTNEIDDLPDRFVLVLDDYHLITEPALHQLFDQLLQHLPLQLHLLLTSRSDPPLALPRLRANRALNELRSADLRFSPQETEIFLAQTVGVEHSAPLADVLLKYTEGWVAGLQLAALSLRAAPDALALAENLRRARNRHITAYFFEQVWQRQTLHVQAILMKTSILDRLSSALAQAVLTDDKTLSPLVDLVALERAGLFFNAVDETGEWFSCHALFREMLFDMLHKACAPDEIATLHLRASRWFHQNGLVDEALRHAVAAGAAELAAQIVADNIVDRLNHEDWHALERWLRLLPAEWIENQPWLLVAEAYVASFQFQYNAIPPFAQKSGATITGGRFCGQPT